MSYKHETLLDVVPLEDRITIYKKAIDLIEIDKRAFMLRGFPLCLLLPCILWDLRDFYATDPKGNDWNFTNTSIAFPEIKSYIYELDGFEGGTSRKNERRKEILKEIVFNLESSK